MTVKNRRITLTPSDKHHEYLEKQALETGMPKTAIIQMAIEQLIQTDISQIKVSESLLKQLEDSLNK